MNFALASRFFSRGLGVVFLIAFVSLWSQLAGLFGAGGIAPVVEFLPMVHKQLGAAAYYNVPSLLWFSAGDATMGCWLALGVAAALCIVADRLAGPMLLLCWAIYLSFCTVGDPFLSFQWDALLLETALLAAWLAPWRWRADWGNETLVRRWARWLLWGLCFRLMFESGLVKLTWGDRVWLSLSALDYHFFTQPLPLPTAWLAHQLPAWLLALATGVMFVIELFAPFLIFVPARWRAWRHGAALALIALQIGILATGNYTFFNLLSILLCVLLLDDDFLRVCAEKCRRLLRRPPVEKVAVMEAVTPGWSVRARIFLPFACVLVLATSGPLIGAFAPGMATGPWGLRHVFLALAPFRSANGYGLFRTMTTKRLEITIEGSRDGVEWRAYRFRYKPNSPHEMPCIVAPHQPRLDWQMWFAALDDVRRLPWFFRFAERLLEGRKEVTSLLAHNPFEGEPPRYIRAVADEYTFTAWGESAWWKSKRVGLYCPPLSLQQAK